MTWLQLSKAQAAGTSVFSAGYLRELYRQDRLWLLPIVLAGMAAGVGSVMWLLLQNYRGLLMLGQQTGHPEILFFFSLLASGLFVFILSIPAALSRFYHSRDVVLLSSLPVTPGQIVLSKTGLLYLFFLLLHLVLFLPAVYVYLREYPGGALFITAVVLQALTAPLVPMILGILAAGLLAGVSAFSRHRILFEVLGMLIVVAVLAALRALMSRQMMGHLSGKTAMTDPDSLLLPLITSALKALPPAAWAAESLTGSLSGLVLSMLFTFALFLTGLGLLSSNITGILSRHRESAGRRKAPPRRRKDVSVRTPLHALFSGEWAVMSSNSAFLFEAAGEALVLPIMLVVTSVVVPEEIIGPAVEFLNSLGMKGLPAFSLILLFTSIKAISSTSLSREGQGFSLSLTLPVSGKTHLAAKLFFHLAVFLPVLAVDITVLYLLLDLTPASLLYIIPGGTAAILLIFSLTIAVDLKNPMLTWTHPQQAMKQNLNTLIGMGLSFAAVILTIGSAAGLYLLGLPETAAGLLVTLLLYLAVTVFLRRAFALAERAYSGGLEV